MAKISKEQVKIDTEPLQINETLTKAEQYIEKNQKIIIYVLSSILVAVLGVYAYYNYYMKPLEAEAQEQIWGAQKYFEADSFKLALNGDGNQSGFLDIIDDYSSTNAGNLAYYYAGISYLYLGQYDDAIKYLKEFSSDDMIINTVATGAMGDAYMEKGDTEQAIKFYLQASESKANDFTTPIYLQKAGIAYESIGKNKEALEIYEKIKADYRKSQEGIDIDKYITRAKLKLK